MPWSRGRLVSLIFVGKISPLIQHFDSVALEKNQPELQYNDHEIIQYMTYALHTINVEYICHLSYRCEIAFNVKLFWSQLTLNKKITIIR